MTIGYRLECKECDAAETLLTHGSIEAWKEAAARGWVWVIPPKGAGFFRCPDCKAKAATAEEVTA